MPIQTSSITTATDGDLTLDPNGTGELILANQAGSGEQPIAVNNLGEVGVLNTDDLTALPTDEMEKTDLVMVQRSGVQYKVPIEKFGGGIPDTPGNADPDPSDVSAVPDFEGGTGTEADPFIITPSTVFSGDGDVSAQLITITNQTGGDTVSFTDTNSSLNGTRFDQPSGLVDGGGIYQFRLQFDDNPASQATTYTGKIKCGSTTVWFQWAVTITTSGIHRPEITNIVGLDGQQYVAPTSPSYAGGSSVGSVAEQTAISGLTADAQSGLIQATSTTGSGLICKVFTTGSGTIASVTIENGGSGYTFGQTVTLNLSSIGGSNEDFTVYTNPVTGPAAQMVITSFDSENAGGFASGQWQFASDENFSSNVTTYVQAVETTDPVVDTGQNPNSAYYARFKYVDSDGTESAYSKTVRAATGNTVTLRYIMKDVGQNEPGFPSPSFDSGSFTVDAIPFLYATTMQGAPCLQIFGTGTTQNGLNSSYDGRPCKAGVYLQLRQPATFKVTAVDGSGGITSAAVQGVYKGIPDNENVARGGSNSVAVTGGSGSSATFFLTQDAGGFTNLSSVDTNGSGYQVNDLVVCTGTIGDGNLTTLDSTWDTLLHGVGGGPSLFGGNAGGWQGDGQPGQVQGPSANGAGGTMRYQLYASATNGTAQGGGNGINGGGGSGGWAGGQGANATQGNPSKSGAGGGGASYINETIVGTGWSTSNTVYGGKAIEMFVNNVSVTDGSALQSSRIS